MSKINDEYLKAKYGRQLSTAEKLAELQKQYDMLWDAYEKTVTQRDEARALMIKMEVA